MKVSIDLDLNRTEVEALKNFVEKSEAATSSFKLFTGRKLFNGEDIGILGAKISIESKNKLGNFAYLVNLKDDLSVTAKVELEDKIFAKLVNDSISDINDTMMIMMIIKRIFDRKETLSSELEGLMKDGERLGGSEVEYTDGTIRTTDLSDFTKGRSRPQEKDEYDPGDTFDLLVNKFFSAYKFSETGFPDSSSPNHNLDENAWRALGLLYPHSEDRDDALRAFTTDLKRGGINEDDMTPKIWSLLSSTTK